MASTGQQLEYNTPLGAAILAGACAQLAKIFTHHRTTRTWDWRQATLSGGMPSSHSSLVSALTSAIAVGSGLSSDTFAVSLVVSLIVMYDAAGIRREAGRQAAAINRMLALQKQRGGSSGSADVDHGHLGEDGSRVALLKERIGHTKIEVAGGALLGLCVGVVFASLRVPGRGIGGHALGQLHSDSDHLG